MMYVRWTVNAHQKINSYSHTSWNRNLILKRLAHAQIKQRDDLYSTMNSNRKRWKRRTRVENASSKIIQRMSGISKNLLGFVRRSNFLSFFSPLLFGALLPQFLDMQEIRLYPSHSSCFRSNTANFILLTSVFLLSMLFLRIIRSIGGKSHTSWRFNPNTSHSDRWLFYIELPSLYFIHLDRSIWPGFVKGLTGDTC